MLRKHGLLLLAAAMMSAGSYADTFGTGANQFSIDFVHIGNVNNSADISGYGAVAYDYRIGTYEVTLDQFTKARTLDSRIGDGDEGYWNDGTRTVGNAGPAVNVTSFEAMKFANWLTTGDAYTGAYLFNISGVLQAVDRDAAVATYGTVYVLPTEDEWYKAAYYKPINDGSYSLYASGLDSVPTQGTASGWNYKYQSVFVNEAPNYMWETGFGAQEQNGTYDMMGNVWELSESAYDGTLNNMSEDRVVRGGSAYSYSQNFLRSSYSLWAPASAGNLDIGLRVVAIPEPSSALLLVVGSGGMLFYRRAQERRKTEVPSRRHFR